MIPILTDNPLRDKREGDSLFSEACKLCKQSKPTKEFLKMPCCEVCIKKLTSFKTAYELERRLS